jgi:hypothetical protein
MLVRDSCEMLGICHVDTTPHSIESTFIGRHERFQYTKVRNGIQIASITNLDIFPVHSRSSSASLCRSYPPERAGAFWGAMSIPQPQTYSISATLGVNIASTTVPSPLVTHNTNTQHPTALCRMRFGSYTERMMVLSRLRVESMLLAILALQCSAALCANHSGAIFTLTHVESADDDGVCGGGPGIQHINDPDSDKNEDLISHRIFWGRSGE